ncbi:hypothetical protein D1223_10250 [Henriciella mobilis]|uniref:Uncharacterized protein n=2 Tax=Henriciella mobilis TaxID=2305467 RepID=A0A399RCM4_9PROT|nr:hypothetical protein D1223_10250 [Henriciella mobilis]
MRTIALFLVQLAGVLNGDDMRIKPLIAFYLIAGFVFVAFSGRAEGMGAPRYLIAPFALLAIGHLAFLVFQAVRVSSRAGLLSGAALLLHVIAPAIFLLCLFIGLQIDRFSERYSMRIGDTLVKQVAAYEEANGYCPASLEQVLGEGQQLPSPILRASSFRLDGCTVWFESTLFTTCRRSTGSNEWLCSD